MNDLGVLQALSDQFNVSLRGGNPARRFLLKDVQDVQDALKAHGVDGSIRIAVKIIADFEDPVKTIEGLGVIGMIPELRFKKGQRANSAVGRIGARQVRAMLGPMGVIRRFCLPNSKMNVLLSGTAICFAL